jgi:integrase
MDNFNFLRGTLSVRSKDDLGFDVKDKEERTVPIPTSMIERLKQWKQMHQGRLCSAHAATHRIGMVAVPKPPCPKSRAELWPLSRMQAARRVWTLVSPQIFNGWQNSSYSASNFLFAELSSIWSDNSVEGGGVDAEGSACSASSSIRWERSK